MNDKIKNLNEQRRKSKPRTLKETAKAAVRRYLNPDLLDSVEEPEGLASGKTSPSGGFVHDNEESNIDEKGNNDEK